MKLAPRCGNCDHPGTAHAPIPNSTITRKPCGVGGCECLDLQ